MGEDNANLGFFKKNYGSRSKKGEFLRFELSHNLLRCRFPNISGGYKLRNRYFKGCLAPKDITHIRQQGAQRAVCYLFEGFMDYLSFLTIRVNNNPEGPRTEEQDYMVLNSVTNLSKAEQLLRPYTLAQTSASIVKKISTMLEFIWLFNLLREL